MDEDLKLKDFIGYFIASGILVVILIILKPILGLVGLIAYVAGIFYVAKTIEIKNKLSKENQKRLVKGTDSLAKKAVFNMPFPLVVTDNKGKILWHNTNFQKIFGEDSLVGMDFKSHIDLGGDDTEKKLDQGKAADVVIKDKHYLVYPAYSKDLENDQLGMSLFYFIDQDDYENLKETFDASSPIIAKIQVDNYTEAIDSCDEIKQPILTAEIDSTIRLYFSEYNSLVKKVDQDEFLVLMNAWGLEQIKAKRFDILDDMKELSVGNSIPITLSIGVSCKSFDFKSAYEEADTSLDIALARGGDQAAIRSGESYEYFGGKSKAVEKRNKVKARVLGTALRQLIDQASDVYIMGHKNADMDAIGSGIGVLAAVRNRQKKGYLVLDKSNPSIDNLISRMQLEEADLYTRIITCEEAINNISSNSLVIMVDNHKPSFTECPEITNMGNKIVIIDHHRRGSEFVIDPVLTYIEPYASSTSELVTEMLSYMADDFVLSQLEADALMSGIVVDTKNFTFQTGVRTFEAASILRRYGADMQRVKALFQDDYDTIRMRAEVVNAAQIYKNDIAISTLERESGNSILIAAQAADELLDINGVMASFVITRAKDKNHISGRSKGEISVQLILEKLGGGGHFNMAGAQVDGSVEEAKKALIGAIDQYLLEGEEKA